MAVKVLKLRHKGHDFRAKKGQSKIIVYIFIEEELSEILSYMCNGLHEAYTLFLSDFNET